MPYIYTSAFHAVRDRNPFLRPLVLDFQEDPHTADICDQFLFGDCIMAAPVLTQGGRRQVYFPQGTWYDFYTGERIEGGRYRSLEVPLSQVPLYVRGDSIIPCCSPGQKVTEGPEPEVLLRRYGTGVWELDYYDDYADGRVTRLTIEDDKTVKAVPARSTVFRLDEEWEARCAPGQEATGNGGEQA